MIKEPDASSATDLCDWAEAKAFTSPRRRWTKGDIIKYIAVDDYEDEVKGISEAERDERAADDVLGVAALRQSALGKAYPFFVKDDAIELSWGKSRTRPAFTDAYLFHLMFCCLESQYVSSDARHHFEIESLNVLHDFFGGESFHFGWTKYNAKIGKIESRIQALCKECSLNWKPRSPILVSKDKNDIGIDAIVWKQPNDQRENAIVILGQCATGVNWQHKITTNARAALEDCLERIPSGPVIYSFLTPFHIDESTWRDACRAHSGVMFDRIRMVLESFQASPGRRGLLYETASSKWLADTIIALRPNAVRRGRKATPSRKKRMSRR